MTDMRALILDTLSKSTRILRMCHSIARRSGDNRLLLIDYPVSPGQQWKGDSYHKNLYAIIDRNRTHYRQNLELFLEFISFYREIHADAEHMAETTDPFWINGWMPALDGVALYGFLAANNPRRFIEVGSGNSTKFARRAISDHRLRTKIISVDPHPRAEVDDICDEIVRSRLEDINLTMFDQLDCGDILYVDSSHRVFMNSDVSIIFVDILPSIKAGVIVHFHDVFLPYDYPISWSRRYYSEQYMLACYLLAESEKFVTILPNMFVARDAELSAILAPLWHEDSMKNVEKHGVSYWLKTT